MDYLRINFVPQIEAKGLLIGEPEDILTVHGKVESGPQSAHNGPLYMLSQEMQQLPPLSV